MKDSFLLLKDLDPTLELLWPNDRWSFVSDLMVIAVEKENSGKVNLIAALDKFAQLKDRRYEII